ncbi:DNA-methyltransferase [Paracholeplasma manati]|uniref:DNA-methyltransferase n=1 Tax=Paracholeplasma manati TaxID=591373 RepID=UPI0024084052|nr:site-specific DNA-methyltransferase [Paracholeplasma manati]MDG0889242.1 site-specific DNA-methyltransferase [Paracholeplasma manati]
MDFRDKIFLKSSENMKELPDKSVDLVVTSPPYNIDIQYGNKTSKGKVIDSKGIKYSDNLSEENYRKMLMNVFSECRRVLKDNGQAWINIKNRYLDGVVIPPFWILDMFPDMHLKNLIVWNFDWGGSTNKRFAPRYEFVFWFTKDKDKYTFNLDEVKIPALNYRPDRYKSQMKNPTDVWRISMVSGNFDERTSHPAQYPEDLIERIILSGTNKGQLVLDPFMGSGTSAAVAKKLGRHFVGYELVKEYYDIANERLSKIMEVNHE